MPTQMTPADRASFARSQALKHELTTAFLQWLQAHDDGSDQAQAILGGWSEAFALALATALQLANPTFTAPQIQSRCEAFLDEMLPVYLPDAVEQTHAAHRRRQRAKGVQ
jgi:hypothetical protein